MHVRTKSILTILSKLVSAHNFRCIIGSCFTFEIMEAGYPSHCNIASESQEGFGNDTTSIDVFLLGGSKVTVADIARGTPVQDFLGHLAAEHPLPANCVFRMFGTDGELPCTETVRAGEVYTVCVHEVALRVWSTAAAFLAQLKNGEVVAWGDGYSSWAISDVKGQLEQGIEQVWSTSNAFLAQLKNGEVVAWGAWKYGADISGVKGQLEQGIVQIRSTDSAFLAQLKNGEVVAWGGRKRGGCLDTELLEDCMA